MPGSLIYIGSRPVRQWWQQTGNRIHACEENLSKIDCFSAQGRGHLVYFFRGQQRSVTYVRRHRVRSSGETHLQLVAQLALA